MTDYQSRLDQLAQPQVNPDSIPATKLKQYDRGRSASPKPRRSLAAELYEAFPAQYRGIVAGALVGALLGVLIALLVPSMVGLAIVAILMSAAAGYGLTMLAQRRG